MHEGWNIGKPPYGYRAKHYRHPNPVKAERGATKSHLEPDGVRAETVTQIAPWRYYERLGYATIVDRLNADPEKYPPPVPPGGAAKARGAWSKSAVCAILRAPKYTGYQVFNRRARRSRRRMLPRWSRRRMPRRVNTSRSSIGVGNRRSGRALAMPWCGRWAM
ncbi:recombinase family protein [Streptomyces sp. MK37H]|uniref:recombinase family protein n=1 Tax=Streptomyces sp. MK37H TaxID=2699117 RepID=UPI001B37BED0|nr:recombinase family protein [Streptomyces sp. MK37H]